MAAAYYFTAVRTGSGDPVHISTAFLRFHKPGCVWCVVYTYESPALSMKRYVHILFFLFLTLLSEQAGAKQFSIKNGDIAALKAAITESNANQAPDTIHLAQSGVYRFTEVDNNGPDGNNALPVLIKDVSDVNFLTVFGNGATLIRDPAVDALRLLYLIDCKVVLYDINLIGGSTLPYTNKGGAMYLNSARLTMYNALLKDNKASEGGAVYMATSTASFTATNCTFTNNTATFGNGSALCTMYGSALLQQCTVVQNTCLNTSGPAAIFNYIPLNANTATDNIFLRNTIVAGNTYANAASPDNGKEFDLFGAVYTQGGNVIGSYPVVTQLSYPTFRQGTPGANNDYVGTAVSPIDPGLGMLAYTGYFTKSYARQAGSVALLNSAGTKTTAIPTLVSNGIIPQTAYAGDRITITGINLAGVTKIQFAGSTVLSAGITVTDTTISMPVPVNAQTGNILVMDNAAHFIFTMQPFTLKSITTPAVPAGLTAAANGTASVTLQWAGAANADLYEIQYKASANNSFAVLDTIGADTLTYAVKNLRCTTPYDFRVIAMGHGTRSPASDVAAATTAPLPVPVITAAATEACAGDALTLAAPAGYAGYTWSNGADATSVEVTEPGGYAVQITDPAGCTSDLSAPVAVTFHPVPAAPSVITGNANPSAGSAVEYRIEAQPGVTYAWSYNGTGATLAPDADRATLTFSAEATSGTLSVTAGNAYCSSPASVQALTVSVVTGTQAAQLSATVLAPNPSNGIFSVHVPQGVAAYSIVVSDVTGQTVYRSNETGESRIDLSAVQKGLYLVRIHAGTEYLQRTVILQ